MSSAAPPTTTACRGAPVRSSTTRAPGGDEARFGGIDAAWLALLVGVALALRAPGLTSHGLYRDEAWPALATKSGLWRALRLGVTVPGFELWSWAWLGPGLSTLRAQLPVLVASLAAIAGVYCLARSLGCGRAAAAAAGGILTLSPIAVVFATRVKQYSFDMVATLLVLSVALAVGRQPRDGRRWALLVAVCVATSLVSASLLPVSVAAIGWCVLRTRSRAAMVAASAYGLFLAGYALVVLWAVPRPLHDSWETNFVDLSSPGDLVSSTWDLVDSFASGMLYRHGPTGPLILAVIAVGALLWRRDVALLVLAPVGVALGLSLAQRVPFGGGRIDMYLFPCVALATAMALQWVLDRLPEGRPWLPLLPELALGVGIVVFAATDGRAHVRINPYPSADVAELADAVERQLAPGDAIVVAPYTRYPWALYVERNPRFVFGRGYTTGFTVASRQPDVLVMPAEFFEEGYDPSRAVAFARNHDRVWYVATDTPATDTPPAVQRHEYVPEQRLLADGFTVERRIDAHGAHADLLVRDQPG